MRYHSSPEGTTNLVAPGFNRGLKGDPIESSPEGTADISYAFLFVQFVSKISRYFIPVVGRLSVVPWELGELGMLSIPD